MMTEEPVGVRHLWDDVGDVMAKTIPRFSTSHNGRRVNPLRNHGFSGGVPCEEKGFVLRILDL